MSAPQIIMLSWFVAILGLAGSILLRRRLQWAVLTSKQQRLIAAGTLAATLGEVATLYAGGFWS